MIYVNDIAESLVSITRLFADDSSLAVSNSDSAVIESNINSDLDTVDKWSKQWLVKFNPNKTEVVFFSLSNQIRPSLVFNGTQLNFCEHHKHLGVTFSEDGSWHEHIKNLTASASKVLGSMRLIKFKVKRKSLNQIYISYLRPIIEYASIVWDNCTIFEKDSLEKIQYEAARTVTGLTRSVSIDRLLREIGWVPLSDRRKIQKLTLVYKHKHGDLPYYLNELFPPTVAEINPYNLRNSNNFITLARRTEIYSKSVIPSSLQLWNELNSDIRESTSLSAFKAKLKDNFKPPVVPSYYLAGVRVNQFIMHVSETSVCSNLNSDRCNNHLRENPSCTCGNGLEDAEHYFFRCTNFTNQRRQLFVNTRIFHPLSTNKLLFGIENCSNEENEFLFKEVHTFIKSTDRFIT